MQYTILVDIILRAKFPPIGQANCITLLFKLLTFQMIPVLDHQQGKIVEKYK